MASPSPSPPAPPCRRTATSSRRWKRTSACSRDWVQAYSDLLISDNTPFDRFLDANPQAFRGFVGQLPGLHDHHAAQSPALPDAGRRLLNRNVPLEVTPGDRLLGLDIFFGTDLSGRNPNFRSARCGNCHSGGTLTNNATTLASRIVEPDFEPEFSTPGTKLDRKPLGMPRVVSGLMLQAMVNGNAQGAVQRQLISPRILATGGDSTPQGAAFFDMGMYIHLGAALRRRPAAWRATTRSDGPLSLAALGLKNLGGVSMVPGTRLPTFDPAAGTTGGLFARTAQDQRINPGASARVLRPLLPPTLAPWIPPLTLGRAHPELDEVEGGFNTSTSVPVMDSLLDQLGPFNPRARLNQQFNATQGPLLGTFPQFNRLGDQGSAKVPQLRNVELTGPYLAQRRQADVAPGDQPLRARHGFPPHQTSTIAISTRWTWTGDADVLLTTRTPRGAHLLPAGADR
jgi:hypothetical protein